MNSFKFIMHHGELEAKQQMIKLINNKFNEYREAGYEWNVAAYKTEVHFNLGNYDFYTVMFWVENNLIKG